MKHSKKVDRTYWVCRLKPGCLVRATTLDSPLTVHLFNLFSLLFSIFPTYGRKEQKSNILGRISNWIYYYIGPNRFGHSILVKLE